MPCVTCNDRAMATCKASESESSRWSKCVSLLLPIAMTMSAIAAQRVLFMVSVIASVRSPFLHCNFLIARKSCEVVVVTLSQSFNSSSDLLERLADSFASSDARSMYACRTLRRAISSSCSTSSRSNSSKACDFATSSDHF